MNESQIVNSREFQLINYMIDQKVQNLKFEIENIQYRTNFKSSLARKISTRIYEEGSKDVEVDLDRVSFEQIAQIAENAIFLFKEINELQTLKCQLLGDVDFVTSDLKN